MSCCIVLAFANDANPPAFLYSVTHSPLPNSRPCGSRFLAIQDQPSSVSVLFKQRPDRRNSLLPETVDALQILKSAYANNHISVDEEAPGRASR
jgi:hypothetical protein